MNRASVDAFVFARRGELLAIPALALAAFGRPARASIAVGLPLALAGEAVRVWAVGYSGVTTRGDTVTAPALVTAGPYAHVRNPLYLGNLVTALGFALAFTGGNRAPARALLGGGAVATMLAVYAIVVPHEERFLQATFGAAFTAYRAAVPPVIPRARPAENGRGIYDASVIARAESRTFLTFGAMLAVLAAKAWRS